jgi:aspartate/methionine/tyrosine aminotransferase
MSRSFSPQVASRLQRCGTTIFTEMTALATKHGAVNLGQGFPDFDGPKFIRDAAVAAMDAGMNQYARMAGAAPLNKGVADYWARVTGEPVDPDTQVTVTTGATEAIASALLGYLNPGDEVILFEPFYDSYLAGVMLAGARARVVTIDAPPVDAGRRASGVSAPFTFDEAVLRAAFTPRTKMLIVNSPHNPTGKVFTRAELELIAKLCVEHSVVAVADEVYERLVYEPALPHVRLATLPGMRDRTITCSSLGKTYSYTGWKIGWAIASPALSKCVRAAHQYLTFCTASPLQHAAAAAITGGEAAVGELVAHLRAQRDRLADALQEIGFGVHMPAGTYFIMANHAKFSELLGLHDDAAFARHLVEHAGVATIPPSVLYANPEHGRSMVRFAFCKKAETMEEAVKRLRAWAKTM